MSEIEDVPQEAAREPAPQPPPYAGLYGQPPGAPPPGYGRPEGGYDPRYGYGPPGVPQAAVRQQGPGDTTIALFCYVGLLIAGFLVPLILYLMYKDKDPFVRHHGAQALNKSISEFIVLLGVSVPLFVVAIVVNEPLILIPAGLLYLYSLIGQYVWAILGIIRASKGLWWVMPTWAPCFRMVR